MTRPDLFEGASAPRQPQQERSRRRRERVLRAAMECFAADGYERASIRAVAAGAGVASGAVYQFFRSKRELLFAAMDALLRHLESFSPPPLSDPGSLPGVLERFLSDIFAREAPFVGAYRAWREASLVDQTIAPQDRIIHSWTSARILAVFTRLAALPGARTGLDLPVLAGVWDRFFWDLLADPPSDSRRAIQSIAGMLSHTFLEDAAVRSRAPSRRHRGREPR